MYKLYIENFRVEEAKFEGANSLCNFTLLEQHG